MNIHVCEENSCVASCVNIVPCFNDAEYADIWLIR